VRALPLTYNGIKQRPCAHTRAAAPPALSPSTLAGSRMNKGWYQILPISVHSSSMTSRLTNHRQSQDSNRVVRNPCSLLASALIIMKMYRKNVCNQQRGS